MARSTDVNTTINQLDELLKFDKKTLVQQPRWGEISFEPAKLDIDRIFYLMEHLRILPLDYLPDAVINAIKNQLTDVKNQLNQINSFSIQTSNPTGTRDSLVNNLHNLAENFYTITSSWVPFLAYQKGDVAENIEKLTQKVKEADTIIGEAKADISAKAKEIDSIIVKAREASGKAGAAVFTQDFEKQAESLGERAKFWLEMTVMIAVVTFLTAGAMWYFTEAGLDQNQLWQKMTTKLAILVLLISATTWCGRIYKAFLHQSIVNKHRALSLQTFQAFSSAADDPTTKDAVLLQTTRAIFGESATGFVENGNVNPEGDIKVLEIAKSVLPGHNGR